jgi:guanosine-3',5'-bis(diphosphate) 3'-pyrophosphohydrolase
MTVATKIDKANLEQKIEEIIRDCPRCKDEKDARLIRKAFRVAYEAHKNVARVSGEPYIYHPVAVAEIVSREMGLGPTSIISALLHDVVEDTDYSLDDIRNHFGDKIALIIDGLTKISGVFDQESSLQAENFRKMLLTLSEDVRVILVKLADRLHNMRTLDALPLNKQVKVAGETIYLYAPLAHRLGFYNIKTELEDLSLKYRHPLIYEEIARKIKDNEKKRVQEISRFSLPIIEKLSQNQFEFEISGRPKSIYSVWHKMQLKSVPFEEVYDLIAMRIVFTPKSNIPEKTQCWNIYSLVTDIYKPKPDRIRDWVSTPKANGYEALHITVMGPNGRWVEVQIRSTRMDEIAERGFAAHWKYKEMLGGGGEESELDKWLKRIRVMLEDPSANALEFLDDFKMNLFSAEIMVFTPKGHLRTLPKNATVLDFAYEIHTEVGNKAIGAKVNHKLVPLNYILSSGDQVEILTSDKQRSQLKWLEHVVTAKAKAAIKNSHRTDARSATEAGMKMLEEALADLELRPNSRIIQKLISGYEVTNKDELYNKIGLGIITLDNLEKVINQKRRSKLSRYWKLTFGKQTGEEEEKKEAEPLPADDTFDYKSTYVVHENPDPSEQPYRIAKCCNPIPGDDVIGYKSPNESIIIHKSTCPTAVRLLASQGNRIVSARWEAHKVLSFLARIELKGFDKIGLINDITTVISKELNVNMRTVKFDVHGEIFEGIIDVYVHSKQDLNNLIMNLIKVKGVDSVKRVEITED